MRIRCNLLLILATQATLVLAQDADDWPSFRNAARDNKSFDKNLADRWPSGGPKLAWKISGIGEGYSSVSVVGDFIYTMGNIGNTEYLIALNRADGSEAWKTRSGNAYREGQGNGPRGTPTAADGKVYSLGGNGDLTCCDAKTGELKWRKNILSDYGAKNIAWGISDSVLVDNGTVVCTPGGSRASVVALDAETGRAKWTCKIPGNPQAGYASPMIANIGGVKQYVIFESQGVVGIRARDGFGMWGHKQSSNGTANCATPLVVRNYVFCSSDYGTGAELLELRSSSGKTRSQQVYFTKDMKNHHGGMVIDNGFVYGTNDGILTCLELESGRIRWRERSSKGSVVFADGHIVHRSERGPVTLFEATANSYVEKGRFDQPQRSGRPAWSHPVIAGGKLFLRDMDKLLAYNVRE